jgi:hypothetical protein
LSQRLKTSKLLPIDIPQYFLRLWAAAEPHQCGDFATVRQHPHFTNQKLIAFSTSFQAGAFLVPIDLNTLITPMPTIILADHKEVLTPYRRQKERYICPACDGHNLTFSDIGEWTCWNNPTREHRFEILDRLFPYRERSDPVTKREPEYPQPIAPTVHPSQLSYPLLTDEVLSHVRGKFTTYRYSDSQRVVRIDTASQRYIYPQFLNSDEWVKGAGEQPWQPYGLTRLLPRPGVTNLLLIVEGQKCVEIAHHRGIPALCLEAGDYSSQTIFDKLRAIKAKFGRLLLVVLPDHDLAGTNKANLTLRTARYFQLPTLLLNPLELEPQLVESGDIEQMPNLDRDRLMQIAKQKLK